MSLATEAPTRTIRVGDDRITYRDVGSGSPIVLLHRFRGTIDHWDPDFVEHLAGGRRVIVFDAPGVGGSTGSPKSSVSAMADDAAAFVTAMGLGTVDVLGWSLGGTVAQALAILHPQVVRRTVLTATGPAGNPRLVPASESWLQVALKPSYDLDDIVGLFYTDSDASRRAANASEQRIAARTDRVPEVGPEAIQAQVAALMGYFANGEGLFERLGEITGPVLIGAGDHDRSFAPMNQVVMLETIPSAQLAMYPDSGHGFHMQHTEAFCAAIDDFLEDRGRAPSPDRDGSPLPASGRAGA